MGLLLVPDDIYNDYWVRWDEATRKWILSTDQGRNWRHLIERPQIDYLTGNGVDPPGDGGPGKGVIFFDGTYWWAYEGESGPTRLLPPTGQHAVLEAKGGTLWNPNGITAITNCNVWHAPYPCTVVELRGIRVGGTTASVNARKNGTLKHLVNDMVLPTTASGWQKALDVLQNVNYAAGDKMEIMLTAVAGSPTEVGIEVIVQRLM